MKARLIVLMLVMVAIAASAVMLAAQASMRGCVGLMPTRMILHERGRVANNDPSPLNVREGAGTSFNRLGNIPVGGVFYVLEGAVCTQNYTWYRVDYRGLVGWVAEGDDEAYYVEPYPAGR